MGQRSSVYLADNLAAAVKASGVPLGELVRPGLAALPDGESSPGVVYMGPGCWQRDTARYGLRRLVLCRACASAPPGPGPQARDTADRSTRSAPRRSLTY